jgi:tetratricopeptide (TPR) repeat protein
MSNITRQRTETLPEEDPGRKPAFQEAIDRYQEAIQAAEIYQKDIILQVNILTEHSYTYALIQDWDAAEKHYKEAIELLDANENSIDDAQASVNRYAYVWELASLVHWKKGQSLADSGSLNLALLEYATAYNCVEQEIAKLDTRASSETEGLYWAHFNAGDYQMEMSNLIDSLPSEASDRKHRCLIKARDHHLFALKMARRLNDLDKEKDVNERLEQLSKQI